MNFAPKQLQFYDFEVLSRIYKEGVVIWKKGAVTSISIDSDPCPSCIH